MARLLSVNVGLPRDIAWKGRTVHTGIWKNPVAGRCRVGRLNLDGDGQGDLVGHGGEQRAVFVHQIESYRRWQEQLNRTDFVHGQFGENFTIEGLPDDTVCIGDRYRIGSALFEITQPRVTCYRVGIRMNEPRMPALLTSSGRPLTDPAESGWPASAGRSAGAIRGPAASAEHRSLALFSQLFALRSRLGRALSNKRENRAEWRRWNLPARACPRGRCA
jgi:MOSC domain-containing protein YiiM